MSRSQEGFTKYACHVREIGLILTDRVYSMADRNIIVSLLWTIDFIICHCLMHQENLCTKAHSEIVMVGWKQVKFSRAQGMLFPQFKSFWSDSESEYINVPFCMKNVGWMVVGCWNACMSLRNRLNHLWMLRGKPSLQICDHNWICHSAFRIDITQHLN
jgi:hypothetical protein